MIESINQLYQLTKLRIAKVRDIKMSGSIDVYDLSRLSNRALHLCLFDLVLERHRENYGRFGVKLSGKVAAHHFLMLKYQWTLHECRTLSLYDLLIALQDEILMFKTSATDEVLMKEITRIHSSIYPDDFENYLDDEWDPTLASSVLYSRG